MPDAIPTHPPSEWCNTDEAAAYLGYSRKALEAWRYSGSGPPFYRVGNRSSIKYAYADLKAWMEAQRVNPSELQRPAE